MRQQQPSPQSHAIADYARGHPAATRAAIGAVFGGLSRQRIHQILRRIGMPSSKEAPRCRQGHLRPAYSVCRVCHPLKRQPEPAGPVTPTCSQCGQVYTLTGKQARSWRSNRKAKPEMASWCPACYQNRSHFSSIVGQFYGAPHLHPKPRTLVCPQGHQKEGENLIVTKRGFHLCRACNNARRLRYYYRDRDKEAAQQGQKKETP